MNIIKTDSGFAIKFPFALKDAFRESFPSAKWDAENKQWTVGSRSGKRLDMWAAEMVAAADAQALKEELEFAADELARVRATAAKLAADAGAAIELREKLAETKLMLVAATATLESAKVEVVAQNASVANEKSLINALLDGIVDRSAITAALKIMATNHNNMNRITKEKFETARKILVEQRERLATAGWRCRGLSEAASANINRPDRDSVLNIPANDWFQISKVEE